MIVLRKISETADAITFAWDPVPGANGYRFTREKAQRPDGSQRYSHTWDGGRNQAKFSKDSAWYRVEALDVQDSGQWPAVQVETLPIYRHTVYPGPYVVPYPGGETHAWHWLTYRQPTVETFPEGSENVADMATIRWIDKRKDAAGNINRNPGGLYKDRELWVASSMRVVKASPSRCLNFHSHGADWPHRFYYCNTRTPPSSCGVSALAFDWSRGHTAAGGARGLNIALQAGEDNYTWPTSYSTVPEEEMEALYGDWIDLLARIILGRYDEPIKGEVDVWANGTLRLSRRDTSTFWHDQGMFALWQGIYRNTGTAEDLVTDWLPFRVGRSREEALAQRPIVTGPGWGSRGVDGRLAHATQVGSRRLEEIALPA